jgi:hypothetical protein
VFSWALGGSWLREVTGVRGWVVEAGDEVELAASELLWSHPQFAMLHETAGLPHPSCIWGTCDVASADRKITHA